LASILRIIILLCLLLVGTASAETISKPHLIISDKPFTPDGVVSMNESEGLSEVEISKIEKGILNGVYYKIYYTDGSAIFSGIPGNTLQLSEPSESNWSVICQKDPINDKKMCFMTIKDLFVFVHGNGKITVIIGHNHFPGSTAAIRIDKDTPMTTSPANEGTFTHGKSAKIVERLKSAKSVTTRYMEWPHQSWVDETWEIYGFNQTFKFISWAVRHIK